MQSTTALARGGLQHAVRFDVQGDALEYQIKQRAAPLHHTLVDWNLASMLTTVCHAHMCVLHSRDCSLRHNHSQALPGAHASNGRATELVTEETTEAR
jgi:hypothetical protein